MEDRMEADIQPLMSLLISKLVFLAPGEFKLLPDGDSAQISH